MTEIAESAGCRIVYERRGQGPPVLFIQGVGVHGAAWRPQADQLAESFTCVSFDNRGIGASRPNSGDITIEQMAQDAVAVMDAAGLAEAHVIGHSMGGLIALELALAAKSRVRSLALLCTFAGGAVVAPLSARMMWWGLRSQIGTKRMRRHGFLHLLLAPEEVPGQNLDALAAEIGELFGHDLAAPPAVQSAQLKAVRRCNRQTRLAELAGLPTLVVSAQHDPIAPPAAGRQLADGIAGARYALIAGASHGLPVTHVEKVNALLKGQLEAAETARKH